MVSAGSTDSSVQVINSPVHTKSPSSTVLGYALVLATKCMAVKVGVSGFSHVNTTAGGAGDVLDG